MSATIETTAVLFVLIFFNVFLCWKYPIVLLLIPVGVLSGLAAFTLQNSVAFPVINLILFIAAIASVAATVERLR